MREGQNPACFGAHAPVLLYYVSFCVVYFDLIWAHHIF